MLEVKDLHAKIGNKEILKGINLTIKDGETHAIMGPNGSGKSTLSAVLVGNPLYEVTGGTAVFNGKDLLAMKPEDRAHEGLFLSFQYPVEIPGVSMTNFMRAAINEKRKYEGKEPMNAADFLKLMREKRAIVELDFAITQISCRQKARRKLPELGERLIYPTAVSIEQCTSETVARLHGTLFADCRKHSTAVSPTNNAVSGDIFEMPYVSDSWLNCRDFITEAFGTNRHFPSCGCA